MRLFSLLLLLASPVGMQGQSHSESRLRGFVEAFGASDANAIRRFVDTAFAKSFLSAVPMATHLMVLGHMRDQYAGWKSTTIIAANDSVATARLAYLPSARSARLVVSIERKPPYGIVDLSLSDEPSADHGARGARLERLSSLDASLQHLASVDSLSAAVLVARGDSVLFARAYGLADRTFAVPNDVDTRFNVASMNKMFTAVAIAQLVAAGTLHLDDPIGRVAPGLLADRIANAIQVRHLLSHTAGLGDYMSNPEWGSGAQRLRTLDDYLRLVQRDSVAFAPGTHFSYSNSGFIILGKIIERISGQSYYDYVATHIFQRAGMVQSGFAHADSVTPNLATGYVRTPNTPGSSWATEVFSYPARGASAGGGYSTVTDLFRFARALQRGSLVDTVVLHTFMAPKPELGASAYGFGFAFADNGKAVGHSGGYPGVIANLDVFPANGYIVVVLGNMTIGHSGAGASDLIDQLRDWVDRQPVDKTR